MESTRRRMSVASSSSSEVSRPSVGGYRSSSNSSTGVRLSRRQARKNKTRYPSKERETSAERRKRLRNLLDRPLEESSAKDEVGKEDSDLWYKEKARQEKRSRSRSGGRRGRRSDYNTERYRDRGDRNDYAGDREYYRSNAKRRESYRERGRSPERWQSSRRGGRREYGRRPEDRRNFKRVVEETPEQIEARKKMKENNKKKAEVLRKFLESGNTKQTDPFAGDGFQVTTRKTSALVNNEIWKHDLFAVERK